MTQIKIRLRPVVQHIHLTMLVRRHRARIDIEIRIKFLQHHLQAAQLQQRPQ